MITTLFHTLSFSEQLDQFLEVISLTSGRDRCGDRVYLFVVMYACMLCCMYVVMYVCVCVYVFVFMFV